MKLRDFLLKGTGKTLLWSHDHGHRARDGPGQGLVPLRAPGPLQATQGPSVIQAPHCKANLCSPLPPSGWSRSQACHFPFRMPYPRVPVLPSHPVVPSLHHPPPNLCILGRPQIKHEFILRLPPKAPRPPLVCTKMCYSHLL